MLPMLLTHQNVIEIPSLFGFTHTQNRMTFQLTYISSSCAQNRNFAKFFFHFPPPSFHTPTGSDEKKKLQ